MDNRFSCEKVSAKYWSNKHFLQLVCADDCSVSLVIVDDKGKVTGCGHILNISEDGIHLYSGFSPPVDFPIALDTDKYCYINNTNFKRKKLEQPTDKPKKPGNRIWNIQDDADDVFDFGPPPPFPDDIIEQQRMHAEEMRGEMDRDDPDPRPVGYSRRGVRRYLEMDGDLWHEIIARINAEQRPQDEEAD